LAIWRKGQGFSPAAHKLLKILLEWNKAKFKGELDEKEMISLGFQAPGPSRKSKNQMRRE